LLRTPGRWYGKEKMACPLCCLQVSLLWLLAQVSHGTTPDEAKVFAKNLDGVRRNELTTSSVEVFSTVEESTAAVQPTNATSSSPKVIFHPNLTLTIEELADCFADLEDLHFYTVSGEIELNDLPASTTDPNITTKRESACRITFTLPTGMVGRFRVFVCGFVAWLYDAGVSKVLFGTTSGCKIDTVYSSSNAVLLWINSLNSGLLTRLEVRFSAIPTRPELEFAFTSLVTGYVQTPGWSKLEPYPPYLDSCVTVKAPSQHFIMTSLLAIEFDANIFHNPLSVVQDCEKKTYMRSVINWNSKKGRLVQSDALSLHFESFQGKLSGFKFIFSFHNQSALPQRLPDGKWNCSVPHWADFQQHFLCTLYPECAGGEDDVVCFSRDDSCGQNIFSTQRCFTFVEPTDATVQNTSTALFNNLLSWQAARYECTSRKMRLPSLESMCKQLMIVIFLNVNDFENIYIGLTAATEPLYEKLWRLPSGVIAYNIYIVSHIPLNHPPACGTIMPSKATEVVNCMAKTLSGILCELEVELPTSSQDDTIRIQTATINANASGVDLTLCSANHSMHTFLACDVDSDCWLDEDGDCTAPMTPLPPQFMCTNEIERVPYSLVCDYRVDCNDRISQSPQNLITANFNESYSMSVSLRESYQFVYGYNVTNETTTAVRVRAASPDADMASPVMVVVRQKEDILSWQLPLLIEETHLDKRVTTTQMIDVDVSTMSSGSVNFTLSAEILESFQLQSDKPHNITVSPSEPQFFKYTFPEDVESVVLTVVSRSHSAGDAGPCNIVSVQNIMCPVFDLDNDINYEGRRQTMTTQANFFLEKKDYAEFQSFFVVIFVKPANSSLCPVSNPGFTDYKDLSISIRNTISYRKYVVAIVCPLALFLTFYVVAFVMSCIYRKCGCLKSLDDLSDTDRERLVGHNLESVQPTPRGSQEQLSSNGGARTDVPAQHQPTVEDAALERNSVLTNTSDEARGNVRNSMRSMGTPFSVLRNQLPSSVRNQLPSSVRNQLPSSVRNQLPSSVRNQLPSSVRNQLPSSVRNQLPSSVRNQLPSSVRNQLPSSVRNQLPSSVRNQLPSSVRNQLPSSVRNQLPSSVRNQLPSSVRNQLPSSVRNQLPSSVRNQLPSSVRNQLPSSAWINCSSVRNVLTVAIFYGVPVLQLVFAYQDKFLSTGDQDVCYYNFACTHPVSTPREIVAFNNVFSNVGYVMLGFLYIFLVWRRDFAHRALVKKYPVQDELGVPQHYGLLYAMGVALVIEGVMSAFYHICPSRVNFQFARHESVQAKVHQSYFFMGLIVLGVVIGMGWHGSDVFWVFYALVHMFSTLVLTVMIYIDKKIGWCEVLRQILSCQNWLEVVKKIPTFDNRVVLLVIGNVINWAALYGAIAQPSNFPSHVLYLLIGNLGMYVIFYTLVKTYRRWRDGQRWEGMNPMVTMVILAAIATWAVALYFFFRRLTSWQLSPAESREGNRKCILLDFYDAHDVWHFLSAISLFFSFVTRGSVKRLKPQQSVPYHPGEPAAAATQPFGSTSDVLNVTGSVPLKPFSAASPM
ncbi:hypothetical protein BaRGS_00029316, partial [Batillaria attramentaria]